jgi:hypothetical protein
MYVLTKAGPGMTAFFFADAKEDVFFSNILGVVT